MYIYNTAARMDLNTMIEEKRRGGSEALIEKALENFMKETKIFDRINLGEYLVAILLGVLVIPIVELVKFIQRKF